MDPIDHIDPRIGVTGGGNCLIGPYMPLGLARPGPDSKPPQPTGGFYPDQPIAGFGQLHVSGTGGESRYGIVRVMPFGGTPRCHVEPTAYADQQTACGYYACRLLPENIEVELTCTARAGVHRFRFPAGEANLLFDMGAVVQTFVVEKPTAGEHVAICLHSYIEALSENELAGYGEYRGGWGHDFPYRVHFYARWNAPATAFRMEAAGIHPCTRFVYGRDARAAVGLGRQREVNLVVGVSFVSIAQARRHAEDAASRSFETVRESVAAAWRPWLETIRVEGGSESQRTMLYTLMTRLLCMPADLGVDDEFPLWHSGVRQFNDFYCLWDSVRNANQLITCIAPALEIDFLKCLLDIGKHTGWIPDAWIIGHSAHVQGGCSADILIAEAAMKNLEGIDYEVALAGMRRNAETKPDDPHRQGRFPEYHETGMLSTETPQCASRMVEYAYQDWCIARLAAKLGHDSLAEEYEARSKRIWEMWDEAGKVFRPRRVDGRLVTDFDPWKVTRRDAWNCPYYYEGTAHDWALNVLHDIPGLIARHGGPEAFVKHLDRYFADEAWFVWKEIILHTPWLYIYADRPDRTAETVDHLLASKYRATMDGLPDNEDMGCQSAFYIWASLGLYPLMGQDLYMMNTPVWEQVELRVGLNGEVLTIVSPGAREKRYIVGAKLNGETIDRAWVRHAEIAGGGTLELELGAQPSDWGRTPPA